mmetsp:Transcript_1276/g.2536  ORF Transcript_1276/g.2536 Transcript_1276/m.2536 type:complete len:1853 (-) Transcript_1276:1488-7046(-)|eukprot:CAMPEP_0113610704 /NCGR_PEP_ID=MMETSP0017_2-20120614/5169_1 /TAXON_ID=2856 /ORGANISM="Cylindrotheca closterium" /LENGTH=1852 /DNA_ID=CAMNT_0000519611 /DNA_START=101 /DNA_END=5662 /DNA_ORIENTATION=- /assembly_acc=CAM_ASM_000147
MSSGKPPAGLPVTPAKDGSPNSKDDDTPSRLETLRAKVRKSRQKVTDQKSRIKNSSNHSLDGNSSTSSFQSVETKPLHIQQEQEWKDVIKSLEQDKEALQKELALIKQTLEAKSSETAQEDQAAMWEERFESLEAVNKALKEQCARDGTTKDELSRLCESLEQQLETKVANKDDPSADDSSLARVSRYLREAHARESILNVEMESLQANNVQLTKSANETQAILEKELKDSRLQHQQLSANMRELTIVEETTPMTQVGGSDLALKEQVQELQQIIDAWKQESSSLEDKNNNKEDTTTTDRKRFAELGDSVLRNLQGKVKTLQKVVTTQMAFRRKLESRVNQLLKQVQALRKERSGDNRLDQASIKRISMQLVDSSTSFAAMEAQVAVLEQDLEDSNRETEELAQNAKEQEVSLKQAMEQNESLVKQVAELETKISNLQSGDNSSSTLDSANEMELLMELQAVRDQMDQVTEESKKLQGLLNDETSKNSDLTQQVETLKQKVEQLEDTRASQEPSPDAKTEGSVAVLKKMKVLQEQTDQLIDQAILNKDQSEKSAATDNELDAASLLSELKDIRDKVHSHIEILERAQTEAAKSQTLSKLARERKPGEMDIRIINELTGRQTDLFVMAAKDLTMYDGVYNSNAVRSSSIRKWPTAITSASKQKKIEIQSVLLDAQGNSIKVFSVKELKKCTMKDFNSLVADPFGKIKFVLRCRYVNDDAESKKLKSIRISNEVTRRIKDIIVPISAKANLYDSVYNHDIVRTANIRKWPDRVCKQVAQKTHSIHCALMSKGKERKTVSVEELRTISTDQLVNLADNPLDIIQLVLKCKEDANGETPKDDHEEPAPTTESQSVPNHKAYYIRTRVRNVATGRFQDLVIPESDTLSLFDGLYENDALRLGLIRRWPDRMAEKVKAGMAEIKCALVDTTGTMIRSFSLDELKSVKTNELVGFASERQGVYRFVLWCEDTATGGTNESTFKPTGFHQRNWTPKEKIAQLRIRITNEASKRSKDILVPISPDVSMYDGVYSHESVLGANIRKWPPSVKAAVRQNTSEIKMALFDGDKEMHSFNVEELKTISIKQFSELVKEMHSSNAEELRAISIEQFLELVPEEDSLVQLVLSCQQTPAAYMRELKGQVEELAAQKASLERMLHAVKLEREAAVEKVEQLSREQKESGNAIITELAATVAREALAKVAFDETKTELKSALDDKKKEAETANAKVVELESNLKRSKTENSVLISPEIPKLQAQITALEQEKEQLAKQLENNPLKDEVKELKSKLVDATVSENNLKEDLEMYKRRLQRELIGATANESSVKAELKYLKRSSTGELESTKQEVSELKNEIASYKDKLQQERYMLSCLSTELYDCLYREAELREEVDRMDSDPKHKTIHTDETAVFIKAEYAGVAPDDSFHKDLDSARNLNEALSKQVTELESKMKKLEQANSSKEKEYQQIMDRDEELKESVTSLTSILEQTTETNNGLTSRVDELEAKCASLQKQNEEALNRASLAEDKSKEHSGVLVQVDELKTKLKYASADKERLLNLVERRESIIENLKVDGVDVGEEERSKDVLQMLEKSHEREKKIQMQYLVCVSELEKLTDSSKTYQETADAKLSEAQKEVEEQKYANKLFKGIIAKLNQMNESLEDKNEVQSNELEEIRSKHRELADLGLLDLQNVNKHLSEEVNFLREQKSKFTRTVSKLQGQLNELAKLRTDGEMEQERLKAVISEMEEENSQSLARDKQFDASVAMVSRLTKLLNEEHEIRKMEAEESEQKEATLLEQVESLTKQLDDVKKKLGDPLRSENMDVLITKLREAEAKNRKLRKDRSLLQKELDDVNDRMAHVKREIGGFGL